MKKNILSIPVFYLIKKTGELSFKKILYLSQVVTHRLFDLVLKD